MLKNNEIIYIGNDWFTENKTSSHHIAEILSIYNRVLYVEAAGQRAPVASKRDIKKIFSKIGKALKPPLRVSDNIYVYSPLVVPFHRYGLVRSINRVILRMMIRRAGEKLGFKDPLLWILLPHFGPVAGGVGEKGIVYYCVDEYSAQPNVDKEVIQSMEKELLKKADVVFTVSEKLLKSKKRINPDTYLSLHGVDTGHFKKALDRTAALPDDIARIPGPVVGFFGLIQKRVDLDLIKFLAEKRPGLSFVLIGLVAQEISMLAGLKNIYFLGPKPYSALPDYLRAFDVAVMPYRLTEEMINSNPKKTREYLAAGKPVVSVRIREVEKYNDLVYIADDYEGFLESIDTALKEDSSGRIEARVRAMEQEPWEDKVEDICRKISRHIKGVNNA